MDYLRIRPVKNQFKLNFGELISYKELIYFFTWRDIKVKYKQTVLGFLWAILQPLVMMVIFSSFFGKILNVDAGKLPYPVFVFAGLLIWNLFSNGVINASNSMVSNANIIKKIYFPRLIIPISSIIGAVFDFFMALIMFIGIVIWYRVQVNVLVFVPSLLLSLLLAVLGTLGPGFLLAALNVKYRDFRYILPFMMQALMFITPVIYSPNFIDNQLVKFIMYTNPIAGSIQLLRSSLAGTTPDFLLILYSFISGLILTLIGLFYFKKTEAYFADIA
jgi:lipopolysaccharide transport system permease protein